MGTAGGAGADLQTLDSKVINLLRNPAPDKFYRDAREAVDPLNRTADKIYSDAREAGDFLNRTMDKLYQALGKQEVFVHTMENRRSDGMGLET
jgi:hypothetical protein